MDDFTNSEKVDMHLMYGAVNGNGRASLRLYQERFPSRLMPNHGMFQRLHRQLYENGSFIANTDQRGTSKTVRQTHLEEVILDPVDKTPGTSTMAENDVYMSVNQSFVEFY
ncbi:uncharacterized protein TNCV_5076901 [Trichonephila clavipes]|uniref:DUF4817 domain-containing protein n=1 Tax=Trichonephila clavipes TaxID=2585209 RepID=A0A8X6VAW1_TRICX|nr:uncharacterized protein TNCV_5076901 [Trichonephila clavipes]